MSSLIDYAKKGIAVGLSAGSSQVEVVIINERKTRLEVQNSELRSGDILEAGGAGVRVYIGQRVGLASSTQLHELERIVLNAYHIAKAAPGDPYFKSLPMADKYPKVQGLYEKELAETPFENLVQVLMDGVEAAKLDSQYTVEGSLDRTINEMAIVNSLGIEVEARESSIDGVIGTKYEVGSDTSMGHEPIMGRSLKEIDSKAIGSRAAEKAKARIGAKKVKSGEMDVILDHMSTLGSISALLGSGANGLGAALGTAFLGGKIGEKVASENLNVTDNPLVPSGISSRTFDDEGFPSKKIKLLEKGVLKSYITDSYSAGRLGVKNTGHASRGSLTSKPRPSPSNIIVASGDRKDLVSETKKGILIEDSGLHLQGSSTNISNMVDFGFYIEKGEIKYPIKNTMVGLTVFDALMNIDAITKDVVNYWGSSIPSVRIMNTKVSSGQ